MAVESKASDPERITIRHMRRAASLTQFDVAERVGLSQAMISLYESGRADLSPADLLRVQEVITEAGQKMPAKSRMVSLRALLGPDYEEAFREQQYRDSALQRIEALQLENAELKTGIATLRTEMAEMSIRINDLQDFARRVTERQGDEILSENR